MAAVGAIDEPVRRLAVLTALAESMWMTGRDDPRVSDQAVREVDRVAGTPGADWAVGELATWLARLELLRKHPSPVPEPFRLAFEGRYVEAAAWWSGNGEPFTEAMTLAESPYPEHRARAVRLLDALGARGTADRHRAAFAGLASPVGALPTP